jgi:hypothetical protein
MGRKRLPGRWCWCCGRRVPNERFSQKRRICASCAKLGHEEIAYRQLLRNIDRLLTPGGRVAKHQERTFARYLSHHDLRVRAYAEERRTERARAREAQGALEATAPSAEIASRVAAYQIGVACEERDEVEELGDDIPF